MNLVGILSTTLLSLIIAAPAYAQQEQHDQQEEQKARPAEGEKKAQPEKPAKQDDKNARQEEKNTQQDRNREQKSAQQPDKNSKPEEKNAQRKDKNNQQEQRTAEQQHAQPAQRVSGRIPDDRFRSNFGREHSFRVSHNDYDRDRRFQYGGYWFGFVDPWPSNWLYTQDVFVIEIDGMYYLCNPMYPGINVALNVTL